MIQLKRYKNNPILSPVPGSFWEGLAVTNPAVGPDKKYRVGALLQGLKDPSCVRYRTTDWLLQPEESYELDGLYPGVCFPCGKFVRDGVLFVYYGGADRHVCLATVELDALLAEMTRHPVR